MKNENNIMITITNCIPVPVTLVIITSFNNQTTHVPHIVTMTSARQLKETRKANIMDITKAHVSSDILAGFTVSITRLRNRGQCIVSDNLLSTRQRTWIGSEIWVYVCRMSE